MWSSCGASEGVYLSLDIHAWVSSNTILSLFTYIPYLHTQGAVSALQRGFSLVTCMHGFSLILKFTLNNKVQGGADAALQRVFILVACMHGFNLYLIQNFLYSHIHAPLYAWYVNCKYACIPV